MKEVKGEKYKIAFICTGNTCRSPMAQFIMRDKLKRAGINNVSVKSFGLSADGSPINENAKNALKRIKIKCPKFSSKNCPKNLKTYDAVVCMTASQKNALSGICPHLYSFDDLCGVGDVEDPYGKDLTSYVSVAETLSYCCDKLIDYLIGSVL